MLRVLTDQDGLIAWIKHFEPGPGRVFLTHGEADAAETLAGLLRERLDLDVAIPDYQDSVDLA